MTNPHPKGREPDTKLIALFEEMLSPRYDPVAAIVESETARSFKVIRPGDAPWFRAADWRYESIASIDGIKARLVLLHAFKEGRGALTRTLAGIVKVGLIPTVIDPTRELAATLKRRGWRGRMCGTTFEDRERVWSL